jgi:hypothetical protein
MYYHESENIAAEHNSLSTKIFQVDKFIGDRDGKEFYATQLVDNTQYSITSSDAERILNLFTKEQVLVEQKEYLCRKHKQKIDLVRDDVYYCPMCDKSYPAKECLVKSVYRPKVSDLKDQVYGRASRRASTITNVVKITILLLCVAGTFVDLSGLPFEWLRTAIRIAATFFSILMLIEQIWGKTFIHFFVNSLHGVLTRYFSRRLLRSALSGLHKL